MGLFLLLLLLGVSRVHMYIDTIDYAKDVDVHWDTEYDEPFTFSCPTNQVITRIRGQNSYWKQDNRFAIRCGNVTNNAKLGTCKWHPYANELTQPLAFECERHKLLAGMHSQHENSKEDRRWRFMCCRPQGYNYTENSCEYTDFINEYDTSFDYRVPEGKFIAGIMSEFDSRFKDRLTKIKLCTLTGKETVSALDSN